MKRQAALRILIVLLVAICGHSLTLAQSDPLNTPLSQSTLNILTNEISGQVIYNNMVAVTGAPWIRKQQEFTGTFYEATKMYELAKSYGIENVKIERSESDRLFDYPVEGELWITSPEKKLLARLDADAALIARGSQTADVSGELIYLPPLEMEEMKAFLEADKREEYRGKIALMWSHPRGSMARMLDSLGIQAVISFSSRERYFDPNMVVYSSGSYSDNQHMKLGMTVSWKQWSELLEDSQYSKSIQLRCKAVIEKKQDKFETVFSWIEGTEPEKPGVIFTAHLFEGYTKRGANDNTGGCVVQLEILRALNTLIEEGQIEKPRRNIYFLWPNEISGTYRFISENPEIISKTCININMDMVSEGLRLNNSWLTMGETPAQLASFYDGLANSVLNYVWRTNDIVYLPDSPRGRRGGQYFPKPMMEKNGSIDAFRYYIHEATGGSDHLCFNNSSVAVPGIEFFTWPDYWYHADTDTPDKGDPTQMKRIAFIGAATAYASANCTDTTLAGMIEACTAFGFKRFAERGLSKALNLMNGSDKQSFEQNFLTAKKIVDVSLSRETNAIISLREISSGSDKSESMIGTSLQQWKDYRSSMNEYILAAAKSKAEQLGTDMPETARKDKLMTKLEKTTPVIAEEVRYRIFSPDSWETYNEYLANNTDAKGMNIALSRDSRTLVSYITGSLSIALIMDYARVYSGRDLDPQEVYDYFLLLEKTGYIELK
jgi:hypothetical protein